MRLELFFFFYKNMRVRVYYSQCSLMIVGLIINYLLHASVVLTWKWFLFLLLVVYSCLMFFSWNSYVNLRM